MQDFSNFYNSQRAVEILVSDKYKFVYLIISKNGCSSILASILKYEYNIEFDNNICIWDIINYSSNEYLTIKHWYTLNNCISNINNYINNGYKVFTVIRDDIDRYISWINHIYIRKYGYFRNYNNNKIYYKNYINYNNFINSCIDNYEKIIKLGDLHAIPQSIYVNMFKKISDKIEYINIKELPNYFKQLTGEELIKNNIAKNKICTKETLTKEQLNKIKEQLKKYE